MSYCIIIYNLMMDISHPSHSPATDAYVHCSSLLFPPPTHTGTLSGNPLAMTAGIKTLEILDRPGSYEHLDKMTSRLINGIMEAAREAGHAITGGHISGALLHVPARNSAVLPCACMLMAYTHGFGIDGECTHKLYTCKYIQTGACEFPVALYMLHIHSLPLHTHSHTHTHACACALCSSRRHVWLLLL